MINEKLKPEKQRRNIMYNMLLVIDSSMYILYIYICIYICICIEIFINLFY